jgi:hypothetical protein
MAIPAIEFVSGDPQGYSIWGGQCKSSTRGLGIGRGGTVMRGHALARPFVYVDNGPVSARHKSTPKAIVMLNPGDFAFGEHSSFPWLPASVIQ